SRGNALVELNRFDEALASYDRAIASKPDCFGAMVAYMHLKDRMCLWSQGSTARDELIARCRVPEFDAAPFPFLAMCDDPSLHRELAEAYVRNEAPLPGSPLWRQRRPRDKIRIGYLSTDFREHATSLLIAEVIALHDRSRFEIFAISAGADDGS